MDLHGTHLGGPSQEIRCPDCGHSYWISSWQRSSRCSACGNIQTHLPRQESAEEISRARGLLKEALLGPAPPPVDKLEVFRSLPDGAGVQEILGRYQVEWQLWAMVAKNFADPAYHSAYLSHVTARGIFDRASERYGEHRSVMAIGKDHLWQASVADLMLERIENLAAVRMERGGGIILPYWLLTLPLGRGVFRVAWIAIGLVSAFKLFGLV